MQRSTVLSLVARPLLAAAAVGMAAPAFAAIQLGTLDTFETGDAASLGWIGANNSSVVPGGRTGSYLRVSSLGGSGSGSRVATHNSQPRFVGNYITAGVTAIQVDMANFGTTTLQMRVVLFGLGNRFTSITPVTLAPGSEWATYTFGIRQSDLVSVLGAGTYQDALGDVNDFMIRHDAAPPSSGGTAMAGTVGIDNIIAIPAPGAAAGLLLGLCAVGRRRRR